MSTVTFLHLCDKEKERAKAFMQKHPYGCGNKADFSVRHTATGVGVKVVIRCMGCGAEEDISDYDSW